MSEQKYTIGSRVNCYVRIGENIIWDTPFNKSEDTYGIELRDFLVVGYPSTEYDVKAGAGYIVLVDDTSLQSWAIEEKHVKDNKIDAKYRGKPAYIVYQVAIVGRASCKCDDCKFVNEGIRKSKKPKAVSLETNDELVF